MHAEVMPVHFHFVTLRHCELCDFGDGLQKDRLHAYLKPYQGKDKMWWGDCRYRPGSPLIIYYDHRNPAQSITKTGFESQRLWAIMLGIWSVASLAIGRFAQAFDDLGGLMTME